MKKLSFVYFQLSLTLLVLTSMSINAHDLYKHSSESRPLQTSAEASESTKSTPDGSDDDGELQAGFRFGEEFFLPESSKAMQAEYKTKADGCERVVTDSTVCMVCKDPKTNANYKQCSYVTQPTEKSITYGGFRPFSNSREAVKSSRSAGGRDTPAPTIGFSSPRELSSEFYSSSEPSRGSYGNYKAIQPEASPYNYKDSVHLDPLSYSEGSSKEETYSSEDPAESSDCRKVQKDSQTCTICKDPKTGSDFERCSSSYEPADKAYAYGTSGKYRYPYSQQNKDDKPVYGSYKSNQNESSEDPAESSDCHQVQKDSKTCTICKNPKTGDDTEHCSSGYKSHPNKSPEYEYPKYKSYNAENESGEGSSSYESSPSEYHTGYSSPNEHTYQSDPSTERIPNYGVNNDDSGNRYVSYSGPSYSSAENAAPSVPAVTKKLSRNGEDDDCHQVQKGSMTCTVCKDLKTGGNLERCSYASQPNDKIYKFTKAKTYAYPEASESDEVSKKSNKPSGAKELSTLDYEEAQTKQVTDSLKQKTACKQIAMENSMICTVCKEPNTGASSEQCTYSSIPKENLYTYSKSKAFGTPTKDGQEGTRENGAESRQISDAVKSSPCKQIEKDSMTCTVCKDSKSGASSEQCAYSSIPKEKLYTYSKSKFFGIPRNQDGDRGARDVKKEKQRGSETKVVSDKVKANPCIQVEKDSMICTICKNPKTGENSEQCSYSYKPKAKSYTYTKSKTFGNPRKQDAQRRESSALVDNSGQESRQTPERLDEELSYYLIDGKYRPRGFSKPDWSST